jgi:hypothetical protein
VFPFNQKFTFGIQHFWNIQVFFSYFKSKIQVFDWVFSIETVIVNQIWTMTMYQGAEGQTIFEAHVKVLNVDILVRLCFALAPQQKTLFGRHF